MMCAYNVYIRVLEILRNSDSTLQQWCSKFAQIFNTRRYNSLCPSYAVCVRLLSHASNRCIRGSQTVKIAQVKKLTMI